MVGKYKAYPEYKDTGIKWFGSIPIGWDISALRRSLLEHKQGYYTTDSYVDEGIKLLRITDLRDYGEIDIAACPRVPNNDQSLANYDLKDGDVVFARTGGAGSFGVVKNLKERVVFASYLIRFRFCENSFINDYLRFMLLADSFQKAVKQNVHGGVNQNIHAEDIKNSYLARPPLGEQQKIASFLDHETAKIDTLIEKQQQLIALLKEKRQAVISHAVTKGLNPEAPMRDSGVEWLGEVPEHWNTGRLRYQVDLLVDGTHHSPESYPEGDYRYITAKNIKEHGFDFSNISYISSLDHKEIYSRCSVVKNDVLYIKDGATAGIAMVNNLEDEFSLLSSVALIRPRKNILRPNYLKHHLNASVFKNEMLNRLSGGAMTRFTIDGISRFNILIPPLEEQDRIVELIDSKAGRMTLVIEKAEKVIGFMQERRTALISAAVTGKIDVRNWTPD